MLTGPKRAEVQDVAAPVARPGQVVVDVTRVGVCGTDVELFTGEMSYLTTGDAAYPLRPGHEWCGVVNSVGDGVDAGWLGRRVTGDTMLGCGHCRRCRTGRQRVCADRSEVGIRGGFPGALAEQLAVPATSLLALPAEVDDTLGAMVEPGGNALRAVRGAALESGDRALVLGPGTIGLLAALFARARGVEVHLMGRSSSESTFAQSLGLENTWTKETLPDVAFDAVIDASNAATLPGLAVELVEPGRRVVFVGLSGAPSMIDTRDLALNDVTAVGVLSASGGLQGAIDAYADGTVDAHPLVASIVSLDEVGAVLSGKRPTDAGPGPKIQIDPRL